MKIAKLIIALGLVTTCSLSGFAFAHDNNHDRHGGHHAQHTPIKRMLAGIELSDTQREQVKALVQQSRAEHSMTPPDHTARTQWQALLTAEQFDDAAALSLLQQQQQRQLEHRLAELKLRHQVLQVLTDAQRAELLEKWQRRQQKRQTRQST